MPDDYSLAIVCDTTSHGSTITSSKSECAGNNACSEQIGNVDWHPGSEQVMSKIEFNPVSSDGSTVAQTVVCEQPTAPAMMATGESAGHVNRSKSAVKLLVFDMGHVFVDFDWNEVCAGFANLAGMNAAQFGEVMAYAATLGYEHGRVTTEQFLEAMNERLSLNLSVAQFTALWNHGFHENARMADLLQSLKRSRALYLLSNTNENHYNFLQSNFNVARHFEERILSYEVGHTKPGESIYLEVFKRSGFTPEECLFIDDLEANVLTARKLGMHAIQFVGVEDLKRRLIEYNIEH